MNRNDYVDADFYIQVEPEFSQYYHAEPKVIAAKAARMTQSRPTKPVPNTVLVKLTVRLPKVAFLPLQPAAVVVVPADLIQAGPVVVEADDAREHIA
jgi:hypothetical protein